MSMIMYMNERLKVWKGEDFGPKNEIIFIGPKINIFFSSKKHDTDKDNDPNHRMIQIQIIPNHRMIQIYTDNSQVLNDTDTYNS